MVIIKSFDYIINNFELWVRDLLKRSGRNMSSYTSANRCKIFNLPPESWIHNFLRNQQIFFPLYLDISALNINIQGPPSKLFTFTFTFTFTETTTAPLPVHTEHELNMSANSNNNNIDNNNNDNNDTTENMSKWPDEHVQQAYDHRDMQHATCNMQWHGTTCIAATAAWSSSQTRPSARIGDDVKSYWKPQCPNNSREYETGTVRVNGYSTDLKHI